MKKIFIFLIIVVPNLLIASDNFGDKHVPLLSGIGVGTYFFKHDGELKYVPRLTAFTGFGLFMILDFNFIQKSQIETDIGSEIVLPMPFKKLDFGSVGG